MYYIFLLTPHVFKVKICKLQNLFFDIKLFYKTTSNHLYDSFVYYSRKRHLDIFTFTSWPVSLYLIMKEEMKA